MGTSGAYGGSGGRPWGAARSEMRRWLDGDDDSSVEDVLGRVADALVWDSDQDESGAPPGADGSTTAVENRPEPMPPLHGGSVGSSGRGGGGGGGGGGVSRAARTGSSRASRSRLRAASAGGRATLAAFALRTGDRDRLNELGFDYNELAGLSAFHQTDRIVRALLGAPSTIAEEELREAATTTALAVLVADVAPSEPDTIRMFIVEYVYEIAISELGAEMRDGTRPGADTVELEERLHGYLEAAVADITLPDERLSVADFESAVARSLNDARRILTAGGR